MWINKRKEEEYSLDQTVKALKVLVWSAIFACAVIFVWLYVSY